MGELSNCPRCNALFMKGVRTVCENCYKEEELQFEKVYQYIKKKQNRSATVDDVVESTGVERELIMKFVKEHRLHTSMFPNLSYACEKCGSSIQEGKICNACTKEIKEGLKREQDIEDVRKTNLAREQESRAYVSGVYSRNRHK